MNNRLLKRLVESTEYLDKKDLEKYFSFYTKDMNYYVLAYVKEINKYDYYMDLDSHEMKILIDESDKHHWNVGVRKHLLSIPIIEELRDIYILKTNFLLIRTNEDGESNIYIAGMYNDIWVKIDNEYYIKERKVIVDTRNIIPASGYFI